MDGISFLPQLLGHKSPSRNWIYSWYEHKGKVTKFARNTVYKLYGNGRFYDVNKDFNQENALSTNQLNPNKNNNLKLYKRFWIIATKSGDKTQ